MRDPDNTNQSRVYKYKIFLFIINHHCFHEFIFNLRVIYFFVRLIKFFIKQYLIYTKYFIDNNYLSVFLVASLR